MFFTSKDKSDILDYAETVNKKFKELDSQLKMQQKTIAELTEKVLLLAERLKNEVNNSRVP